MSVHCVDVLDMEDELLLPFFHDCIAFMRASIDEQQTPVLVHCVYGQSRSAAICVAFLMATRRMALRDAYDAVQRARPCIFINTGFLRQLALFERMGGDADIMGSTPAHAEVRRRAWHKQERTALMVAAHILTLCASAAVPDTRRSERAPADRRSCSHSRRPAAHCAESDAPLPQVPLRGRNDAERARAQCWQ